MRKRNMKFMAMFLSLTMVFSMNTFAFGSEASLDEVPSEAVQAEAAEGEEPEVVGINPLEYGVGSYHLIDGDGTVDFFVVDGNCEQVGTLNYGDSGFDDTRYIGEDVGGNLAYIPLDAGGDEIPLNALGLDLNIYQRGFAAGEAAAEADQASGKTDAHDSDVDGSKSDAYKVMAYAAGFEDGYTAYKLHQPIDAFEEGFGDGYDMILLGEKAVSDYKADKDLDPGYNKWTGKDDNYLKAYQKAFDAGVEIGKTTRLDRAYRMGAANVGNRYKTWKDAESYLASEAYKAWKEAEANKDRGDDFFEKYEKGFKDKYTTDAEAKGLENGKDAGHLDGLYGFKKPSEIADDAALADYLTQHPETANYTDDCDDCEIGYYTEHWNIYNKKHNPKDDGSANAGEIVGTKYREKFIEGYDAVFTNASKKAETLAEKTAFNTGFSRGYGIGLIDGSKNNKEAYDEDLKADANTKDEGLAGDTYHKYTETDKQSATNPGGHTEGEVTQYKNGFELGYKAASTTATEEAGYEDGYESGKYDANHDRYTGNPYDGFYEIGTPGSAYETVDPNTSYGKGYRAGYKDGYDTVINNAKLNKRESKPFDYTAADMDAWRISTDPAKWDTTQILINESAVGADGNGESESLYFDTRSLAETWRGNPTVQFLDKNKGRAGSAADIVATSPFQYYFDLYGQDHLVDKKTVSYNLPVIDNVYVNGKGINRGSIGQYMYAALSASSNKAKKPKKGVSDNGTTYILLRYRLVGAETDENYKVKRYAYDANGAETVVVDTINDYYQGENGSEPVVNYDSRKIAGVKRDKDNNILGNDKANRYVIDAEALVVTWQEGAPAKLIGKLDLNVSPKDNINATVPHNYLEFLGDTDIVGRGMPRNAAGDNINAVEFIQTDKDYDPNAGVPPFSKYYTVTESNKDGSNAWKDIKGVVKFAGTKSAPKLTTAESAYVSKKGAAPSFTLKAKTKDPALKAYMKDAKQALKKATFNFEISRMKLASDYISDADKGNIPLGENGTYPVPFEYEDTVVAKLLNAKFVAAPKRSECGSNADYEKKVEEYIKALAVYDNYKNSEEFKKAARAEFKKAVEAYQAEYNTLKTKYGSKLDTFQKWIEEHFVDSEVNSYWSWNNPDGTPYIDPETGNPAQIERFPANEIQFGNGTAIADPIFPYTVTKDDRAKSATGEPVPVGNTPKYKETVPEDANCDGIITVIEHYEYVMYGVDDPRFDGQLEAGDNIAADYDLVNGKIDFDNVGVGVGDGEEGVDRITFTYNYDVDDRVNQDGHIRIKLMDLNEINNQNVSESYFGKYLYELGTAAGAPYAILGFDVYIDFLEDQATDIDIVEQNENIKVLYPGTARAYDGTEGWDLVEVSFKDPKAKISKNPAKKPSTLTVKPILTINTTDNKGFEDTNPAVVRNVKTEKKLKVYATKPGVSANKAGKMPKADVQIDSKMAETEPFIVATGINNYEGSIAIRQRKNGDLGYGYFKDDDFYYIFSDED